LETTTRAFAAGLSVLAEKVALASSPFGLVTVARK
jgi:hypothetical protein